MDQTPRIMPSSPLPQPSARQQPTLARYVPRNPRLLACETRNRNRRSTWTDGTCAHALPQSFCSTRMEEYAPPRACRVDQRRQGKNVKLQLGTPLIPLTLPRLVPQHAAS